MPDITGQQLHGSFREAQNVPEQARFPIGGARVRMGPSAISYHHRHPVANSGRIPFIVEAWRSCSSILDRETGHMTTGAMGITRLQEQKRVHF
jgi:hypothetical protein